MAQSRVIRFLKFHKDVEWHLEDPEMTMEGKPPQHCQLVVAMCAMHVASGTSNLVHKVIKCGAIEECVSDVAKFIS